MGETRKNTYGKNGSVILLDGTQAIITLLAQMTLEKHFFQRDVKNILPFLKLKYLIIYRHASVKYSLRTKGLFFVNVFHIIVLHL